MTSAASIRTAVLRITILALIFILLAATYQFFRPLQVIKPTLDTPPKVAATSVSLLWPTYGQAALSESSFGLLNTHGSQKPVPMASTAKIVTALAVMKQKPLAKGSPGPMITIGQDDVAIYNNYYLQGGSVAKVEVGEQISQYQALQAMLLPSANNLADTMARWAFGSVEQYVNYANDMLSNMHLKQTHVADASGFSKNSISTAEELTALGEQLMKNEVLAEIVGQASATLPVAGKVENLNWLLGSEGVIGIKTGNTDEAGGCFVFTAKRQVLGQMMVFVGAIMGAPSRNQAIADSRTLLRSIDNGFIRVTPIKKDQLVGRYTSPWESSTNIIAKDDFSFIAWKSWDLNINSSVNPAKPGLPAGSQVGELNVWLGRHSQSVPLVLKDSLPNPPLTWRLLH